MKRQLALTACVVMVTTAIGLSAEPEFQPIFDGVSLRGWETPKPEYWSVEGGAITARITKERPCQQNQYLVWRGGELADFELKMRCRVQGEGAINNGFQFRSRLLPDYDLCGYQVDNNLQTDWLVRLYDEYGRHTLAWRGEHARFSPGGERSVIKIPEASRPAWFRLEDWHEYHLTCIASQIILRVDGQLAADVEDLDERRAELQGLLALQLHSGPPTTAQFKDIRLKVLKPAASAAAPEISAELQILRGQAVAWWDLDTFGHGANPTLRHIPEFEKFELNVAATGPGATPRGKVLLLHGAYGQAGPDLSCCEQTVTVYARARDPKGAWDGVLVVKNTTGGKPVFRLAGQNGHILFAVTSEKGIAEVGFPISAVDARAWHDLVGQYDGEKLVLFCDGQPVAQRLLSGLLMRSPEPLLIGADREDGKPVRSFVGEFESVGIWARPLDAAGVKALSRR